MILLILQIREAKSIPAKVLVRNMRNMRKHA
jgi:hypothetical protein